MYISEIKLIKIKCFKEVHYNFDNGKQFTMLSVILGDNAVGKSTVLKCIAMGLTDVTSAGALMKETSGEMLRKNELEGFIIISLKNSDRTKEVRITTKITKDSIDGPEKLYQITENSGPNFNLNDIFICGYGVNRSSGAGNSQEKYSVLESTYTLFNKNGGLQNSELVLLRQDPKIRNLITRKLAIILGLTNKKSEFNNSIKFTKRGMEIDWPWGTFLEGEMSDGYQSTTNWVIDFFGWQILANKFTTSSKDIEGILLIDEIENHLHPRWQNKIVKNLKEQLPNVQIITTSHSPIIAKSIGDIETSISKDKLYYLKLNSNNETELAELEYMKGMDLDQILGSRAFGYQYLNLEEDRLLKELSHLSGKGNKRSNNEEKMYAEIKQKVKRFVMDNDKSLFEQNLNKEIEMERQKIIETLEKKLFT